MNSNLNRNIRVVSDLHLEYYSHLPDFEQIITPNPDDILCLLGDIGNPFHDSYYLFLKWCRKNFAIVLLITGNREYYGSSIQNVNFRIEQICHRLGIFFLNNQVFLYKNLAFIGTTLWSYIPDELFDLFRKGVSGYHMIEDLTLEKVNQLFFQNITFLNQKIDQFKKDYKVIVLTHHSPLLKGTSLPHLETRPQNHAYSSDLSELIKKVDLWIYGHTHYNHRGNVFWNSNVPLVCNQVGYPGQLAQNYNKDFFITTNF